MLEVGIGFFCYIMGLATKITRDCQKFGIDRQNDGYKTVGQEWDWLTRFAAVNLILAVNERIEPSNFGHYGGIKLIQPIQCFWWSVSDRRPLKLPFLRNNEEKRHECCTSNDTAFTQYYLPTRWLCMENIASLVRRDPTISIVIYIELYTYK